MSLEQLKQRRSYIFMISLLAAAISISACQKQEPESDLNDRINTEEAVPMSAEPAEPSDIVVLDDDDDVLNEAEGDGNVRGEIENDTLSEVENDTAVDLDTDTEAAQ